MEYDVIYTVHFHDAIIVGIGNQRVAAGQPACKCHAVQSPASSERSEDLVLPRHLDSPIVVLVGDEYMSVGEEFSTVRIVEKVVGSTHDASRTVLPDDLMFGVHFDNALVALIGDKDIEVWQKRGLHRRIQLIGA